MQTSLFSKGQKAYGGSLFKTRKGRATPRPISTQHSMHLVMRSSLAKGQWSFRKRKNRIKINQLIKKFSVRFSVDIYSVANVGNHLHFHIKLKNRQTYRPFIRALSASISMAVTGYNKWNKPPEGWKGFWSQRPFTRILVSFKEFLNLKDYLYINRLEGYGYARGKAEYIVKKLRHRRDGP